MDEHRAVVALQRLCVGIGLNQRRAVAEIAGGVAQRGKHEVQLLAVIATFGQRGGRLDEQHLAMGMLTGVDSRAELIGEQPQGSVVAHPSEGRREGSHVLAVGIRAGG